MRHASQGNPNLRGIGTLGQISESTKVNKATTFHKSLVKQSKQVEKREAGLYDKNIKAVSEEETDELTQDEDMDSDGDLLHATKRKKIYKTQFEDYNERIQKLEVFVRDS